MPAASESDVNIHGFSVRHRQPMSGTMPDRRSIAQSGGSDVGLALLKTKLRLWYSEGTPEMLGGELEKCEWSGEEVSFK